MCVVLEGSEPRGMEGRRGIFFGERLNELSWGLESVPEQPCSAGKSQCEEHRALAGWQEQLWERDD